MKEPGLTCNEHEDVMRQASYIKAEIRKSSLCKCKNMLIKWILKIILLNIIRLKPIHQVYSPDTWCLSQARINLEGYGRKGIQCKNGRDDGDGGTDSQDGWHPAGFLVHLPLLFPLCTIKPIRLRVSLCGAPHEWVMFLLVPAHPGSPGQMAIKRLLLLLLLLLKLNFWRGLVEIHGNFLLAVVWDDLYMLLLAGCSRNDTNHRGYWNWVDTGLM